ncbi:MAG TPA: hypothetical protein VLS27_07665 [Gammaproteobacteria bacterium]|nr:hypothetical protein [Gammaproteobacteria bacterium]
MTWTRGKNGPHCIVIVGGGAAGSSSRRGSAGTGDPQTPLHIDTGHQRGQHAASTCIALLGEGEQGGEAG